MSPRLIRAADDPIGRDDRPVTITVDGAPVTGVAGQSIAGVLLAAGRTAWRHGRSGAGRGVFCGIGVCFDCLLTVNGAPDVRACRRRAHDGDAVTTQSRAPAQPDVAGSESGESDADGLRSRGSDVDGSRAGGPDADGLRSLGADAYGSRAGQSDVDGAR